MPWLAALLLGGCVLTLEPLGADAERVFDAALVGTWKPRDASETWRCRADGASYRIDYEDEHRRRASFTGSLFALGAARILDLAPRALPDSLNALYADHWVAAHSFARVLRTRPKLALALLDQDWLEKQLAADPGALAHRNVRGHVVVTASTAEFRRFVLAHLETEGAFRSTLELERAS